MQPLLVEDILYDDDYIYTMITLRERALARCTVSSHRARIKMQIMSLKRDLEHAVTAG
jgi:hypothetical protein